MGLFNNREIEDIKYDIKDLESAVYSQAGQPGLRARLSTVESKVNSLTEKLDDIAKLLKYDSNKNSNVFSWGFYFSSPPKRNPSLTVLGHTIKEETTPASTQIVTKKVKVKKNGR